MIMNGTRGTENPAFESDGQNNYEKRKKNPHADEEIINKYGGYQTENTTMAIEEPPIRHPRIWNTFSKHRWCPSYPNTTRTLAFVLIGLVTWYTLYILVGDTMKPPDGPLFQIILASVSSILAGWLVSLTRLPGLIGMLLIGILYQNTGVIDLDARFAGINKFLRGIALIVILVRAGLGLDADALKRLKFDILKLGLLPWLAESLIIGVISYFWLNLPWSYGLALGFALSAISPAVTIPCLLRLKSEGYGVKKGIPTLVMAITTLTDVFSVVCFGIIQSFIFSTGTLTILILQLPVSVVGGICFGLVWGLICSYVPESHDSFVSPLRIMLILSGGIISVFGSDAVGFGGAGPLACVVAPFVAVLAWIRQGWRLGENPVSVCFKFFWTIFEPVLFVITGAQIKINQLDGNVMLIGTAVIIAALLVRIILTFILSIGSIFNFKEKLYFSVAMGTKATVQAALAPVLIGLVKDQTSDDYKWAEKVMMINILSIILTTPPLAIFMEVLGKKLLGDDSVIIRNKNFENGTDASYDDDPKVEEANYKRNRHNSS